MAQVATLTLLYFISTMRLSRLILCLTAVVGSNLCADTIVLKTGKKIEGEIISQDDKDYLVQVFVTKSIKDERRIPKDEVARIIKESPDVKAFHDVAALVPTPDLLTASSYQKRLAICKDFISKFPNSAHHKDAKKILATLENEFKTISAGGIKQDGQLIARADMEANSYEIHARMLLHSMNKYAAARHYMHALRKWEILRTDYKNSTSFKKGIPVAKRTLRLYQISLKQLLDTLDVRIEKRKSALRSMSEGDRERTLDALAERKKIHLNRLEREKTIDKLKWLSIDPLHKESLSHSFNLTGTELSSIANIDTSKIELAGASYRDTWTALAEENLEVATAHIKNLKSLRIPERYIQPLEEKLEEKQNAIKAAEKRAKLEAAAKERARLEKLAKEAAEKAEAEKNKGKKNSGKKNR